LIEEGDLKLERCRIVVELKEKKLIAIKERQVKKRKLEEEEEDISEEEAQYLPQSSKRKVDLIIHWNFPSKLKV